VSTFCGASPQLTNVSRQAAAQLKKTPMRFESFFKNFMSIIDFKMSSQT